MTTKMAQFHLAFPVRDLEEARAFYVGVVGCEMGRETDRHLDFNMFGHHVVAHIAPPQAASPSEFDGHEVPVPHFGLNLDQDEWSALADRFKQNRANFREYPHVRLEGQVGEHDTMFVYDPSGNALEFKAFRDPSQAFQLDPNEAAHGTPDNKTVIRPMIEAEVFRVCGDVAEELHATGLLDSVKAIELVNALQGCFRISLDGVRSEDLETIEKIVDVVDQRMSASAPSQVAE
jgi:hypothetical protein